MKVYNRTNLSENEIRRIYDTIKFGGSKVVTKKNETIVSYSGFPDVIFTKEDNHMMVTLVKDYMYYRNLIPGEESSVLYF